MEAVQAYRPPGSPVVEPDGRSALVDEVLEISARADFFASLGACSVSFHSIDLAILLVIGVIRGPKLKVQLTTSLQISGRFRGPARLTVEWGP